MLALYETPAGYALFQVQNPKALKDPETVHTHFTTVEGAQKLVKLKEFCKFADNDAAVKAAVALSEGTLDKALAKFLQKAASDENTKLAVLDQKLGGLIKEKLGLDVVYNPSVIELMRGIRLQIESLVTGLTESNHRALKLGLAHNLCRYTISFSPDKVDTMIVHAISLLDELDKELNVYAMRSREWYGVHFPEMSKLIDDHAKYAKIVNTMGTRNNASKCDFSAFLSEEEETRVKDAAEVSMGTEIAEEDINNIRLACEQVITLGEYRATLFQYLQNRMNAIAPNLTALVGELVGARLIAHTGSLTALAKQPASTVQILGAEKALFRAIKTSRLTPKYGLIYHASLVGQAQPATKGKIARMLAAKASIAVREDALGDSEGVTVGYEHRVKLEKRLRDLESGKMASFSGKGGAKGNFQKYQKPTTTRAYNETADIALPAARKPAFSAPQEEEKVEKSEKKEKKEKKDKKDKKEKKDKKSDMADDE